MAYCLLPPLHLARYTERGKDSTSLLNEQARDMKVPGVYKLVRIKATPYKCSPSRLKARRDLISPYLGHL